MTRDDLELLDTPSLRALARQHLPDVASTLHTRAALLTALARKLVPRPAPRVRRQRRPSVRVSAQVGAQLATSAAEPPPAAAALAAGLEGGLGFSPPQDVLVEEGFFVVHAQQRGPSRRPAPKGPARRGTAPLAVPPPPPGGAEVPHLLVRDPTTLFLFWDFQRDLERGAAFGLDAPRVLFRLYRGDTVVRTVEAPLNRRSLYLEGLEPAGVYSVEAWLQGSDGHARPTGRRSAPLRLPPAAPSAELEVRLVRVPFQQPLSPQPVAAGPGPSVAGPSRLDLPASLQWRGGPGPGGPRSGRP